MLLRKILAHSCIVLGGMFLTFSIINHFNDAMNFIGNDISLALLFIWSILSMVTGGLYVSDMFRRENRAQNQQESGKSSGKSSVRSGAARYKR